MSSVNNNNPIVGVPAASPAAVQAAGQATQGVIDQMQSIQAQVTPLNNNIQSATASLGSIDQQISDLENTKSLSSSQQTTLSGLLQLQQSMVSEINSDLQNLKQMQQELQQLMAIQLPQAEAKDKEANDEQAKTQEQQLADQEANAEAAAAAYAQANTALQEAAKPGQQALQKVMDLVNPLKETNSTASSEYNTLFAASSGYNDWSGLNS